VYVPRAVACHRGSSTLGKWNPDTVRRLSRNQVLLAAKYFQGQPRWPLVAGQLLWGLLALRHGRGVPYLMGKISGLRAGRRKRSKRGCNSLQTKELRAIFEASETEILELEQQTQFDWYWRTYFWLLRR
jgi:GT2 family glycosyltransferase